MHEYVLVGRRLALEVLVEDDAAAAVRIYNLLDVAVDVVEVVVVEHAHVVHDQPLLLLHAPSDLLRQPLAFARAVVVADCIPDALPSPDRLEHLLLFEHQCRDAWRVVLFHYFTCVQMRWLVLVSL